MQVQDEQTFRVRRADVLSMGTLLALCAGAIGLLSFFFNFSRGIEENCRVETRNERVERINSDQRIETMIYDCCNRGRR